MQKWFKMPKEYLNNVTRQSVEEKTHSESKGILCTKFQLTLQILNPSERKHLIIIIWNYN